MTTLLIGGDVCPVGRNKPLFQQGRADVLLNDLVTDFQQADFRVVNLECPLITRKSPIEKDGPPLGTPVECVHGLRAAGIDAVNLANNHILDHGESGLRSTMAACQKAGIACFGAGANTFEAGQPLIRTVGGRRIAFLGVAEHEFSIASKNAWGANPLDLIEVVRTLRRNRNEHDFLVVLVHGGREHYSYPSPRLQEVCRFLVEEGAAAVVCQHSHCAGCYEHYQGAPIVYGQGNLLFDRKQVKRVSWYEGLLVRLTLQDGGGCKADWIAFCQGGNAAGARRMPPAREREFLKGFKDRSREISAEGTIQRRWLEYCRAEKHLYASRLRGHNRFLRVLNRKLHFSDWLGLRSTKLMHRNVVECEIHREVLETLWRDPETDF